MKLTIDVPTPARVDRRFLWVVLAFGLATIWGGSYWLQQGEIAIRRGNPDRRPVVTSAKSGEVVGRIADDHPLFYPVCVAWVGLGITMLTLSISALLQNKIWLDVLSAWSLAAILPLGFLTLLTAYLVKSG